MTNLGIFLLNGAYRLAGECSSVNNQEENTPYIEARSATGTSVDERFPANRLSIGSIVDGRYEILSYLGEGGMSVAYKATDRQLNEIVVIKLLLSERISHNKDLLRFKREAAMASSLQHPGIAKVFGFGTLNDIQPYLVMEFIEGKTLAQRIELEGQLPVQETLDIFILLLDAVAYAHANGILHRDIKPSNIIVAASTNGGPIVKLLDFGIAKPLKGPDLTAQQITETGDILGSPFYMSPEQARGAELDARSDLYSVGCTLYEALTGGPPHVGQTPIATLLKREQHKPIALAEASLGRNFSEQLEAVIASLLQNLPDNRYQTALQLKEDLIAVKEGRQLMALPPVPTQTLPDRPDRSFWQRNRDLLILSILIPFIVLLAFSVQYLVSTSNKARPSTAESPVQNALPEPDSHINEAELQSLLRRADAARDGKRYPDAVASYEAARKRVIDEKITGPLLERVIDGLAVSYTGLTQYEQARPFCELAATLRKNEFGPFSEKYADALNELAGCYILGAKRNDREAWKKAAPLLQQATAIYQKASGPNSVDMATCLHRQGFLCSIGQPQYGQQPLERALAIYRKKRAPGSVTGQVLRLLANIYNFENQPAKAEAYWLEALRELAQQSKQNEHEVCQTLIEWSNYYTNDLKSRDVKRLRHAKDICMRYFPLYVTASTPAAAVFLNRVAELDLVIAEASGGRSKDFKKELALFQKALDILKHLGSPVLPSVASVDLRIAEIHRLDGDPEGDEKALMEAFNVMKQANMVRTPVWLNASQALASSYLQQGKFEQAASVCRDELAFCDSSPEFKDSLDQARLLSLLGASYSRRGNYAQAEPFFKRARALYAKLDGVNSKLVEVTDRELEAISRATSK